MLPNLTTTIGGLCVFTFARCTISQVVFSLCQNTFQVSGWVWLHKKLMQMHIHLIINEKAAHFWSGTCTSMLTVPPPTSSPAQSAYDSPPDQSQCSFHFSLFWFRRLLLTLMCQYTEATTCRKGKRCCPLTKGRTQGRNCNGALKVLKLLVSYFSLLFACGVCGFCWTDDMQHSIYVMCVWAWVMLGRLPWCCRSVACNVDVMRAWSVILYN